MKKLIIGILLVTLSAFASDTEQIIYPKDGGSGSTIIRAIATAGVYIFTNTSERPVAVKYMRVLSSGILDGVATNTYTRSLTFSTNKVAVVQTNYANAVVTNWMYANVDGSTHWTNTVLNTVTGTEFNVDFNDDLLLTPKEKLTIKFPVTTNTYYMDIHATKE